jgi:long-chain acyl-CoA synthetase
VLYRHPKIMEAAAVGVPSAYRGETVKAVIVVRPGEGITAEEIMLYCRRELAPFKVPTIVEFRDALPRTSVGKVIRSALLQANGAGTEQTA